MIESLPEWIKPFASNEGWKPPEEGFSPEVLAEARKLAQELQEEYAQRSKRDYLRAVEDYLTSVVEGHPLPVPVMPDPVAPEISEEWLAMLAMAFKGPDDRITRLNLATRRSSVHFHSYELGHEIQITTFHVAALRSQAAPYPHAEV